MNYGRFSAGMVLITQAPISLDKVQCGLDLGEVDTAFGLTGEQP